MPTPSATFSPLTTQQAASSCSPERGESLLERLAPRASDDVGDEEDPHGVGRAASGQRAGGRVHLDSPRCCPAPRACSASAWRSTAAASTTVPSLDAPASVGEPTARDGSGLDVGQRDDHGRGLGRPQVDARAVRLAVDHVVGDRRHRALDRGVHVGAGRRSDVDHLGARALSELVPDGPVFGAPAILRQSRARSPSFTCLPTGCSSSASPRRRGSRSRSPPRLRRGAGAAGCRRWRRPRARSAALSAEAPRSRRRRAGSGCAGVPEPNAVSSRVTRASAATIPSTRGGALVGGSADDGCGDGPPAESAAWPSGPP